jgi:uncharacterized protein
VAVYVDTSALVKLVVAEPGSDALRAWLAAADRVLVASDVVRTELVRAVRRGVPDRAVQARTVLDSITLMTVTAATIEAAARLDPASLRTLDAVHLASAMALGDDLDGLLTYDERLADAARAHGVQPIAPA